MNDEFAISSHAGSTVTATNLTTKSLVIAVDGYVDVNYNICILRILCAQCDIASCCAGREAIPLR